MCFYLFFKLYNKAYFPNCLKFGDKETNIQINKILQIFKE